MVKRIVTDVSFLSLKADEFTKEDIAIYDDMVDTLEENRKTCVGMAGNMLGYKKKIISFIDTDEKINIMINPVILKQENRYETEEGCLSLTGKRPCVRYKKIKVGYYTKEFQYRIKTYTDFTAEIIQHEIDHLNGIII